MSPSSLSPLAAFEWNNYSKLWISAGCIACLLLLILFDTCLQHLKLAAQNEDKAAGKDPAPPQEAKGPATASFEKFTQLLKTTLGMSGCFVLIGIALAYITNEGDPPHASFGLWIWGSQLCLAALLLIAFVCYASVRTSYAEDGNHIKFTPHTDGFKGLYAVMKENGSLVGVVLGFASLAWIQFFTAKDPENKAEAKSSAIPVIVMPGDQASREALYHSLRKEFDQKPAADTPPGEVKFDKSKETSATSSTE